MEDGHPRPGLVLAHRLGHQVWLTTATPDGKELSALCLDLASGRVV
jgi:hypothetical protein